MKPIKARGDLILATEATFDDEQLRAKVTIIRPGMSKNRKDWNPEVLRRASESGFWNGSRMYLDHPDKRPGAVPTRRKMRELVSGIESTTVGEDGRIIADVVFFDDNFYSWAKRAKDYIGTSVNLLFSGKEVRQQGQQPYYAVEELVTNNSVDWVIDPAAGGQIESFYTATEGEDDVEWSDITPEMLKQHRPDLLAATESTGSSTNSTGSQPVSVTADQVADIVKRTMIEAREEWQRDQETREGVRRQYRDAIQATKLPQKTQNRLIAAFEDVTAFDQAKVDAAIKAAQEELEDAGVKPQLRGGGISSDGGDQPVKLASVAPIHAAVESAFSRRTPGTKSTEGGND